MSSKRWKGSETAERYERKSDRVTSEADLVVAMGANSGGEITVEERGLLRIEDRLWIASELALENEGEETEVEEFVRLRLEEKVGDLPHEC